MTKTSIIRADRRDERTDWVLVDKRMGVILRGLPRWEIAYQTSASVELIELSLIAHMAFERDNYIVVGEWRPRR